MTPPSLTVAREFLAAHVASGRERPDLEAAIRVVLDRVTACEALDQSIHGAASVITVSAVTEPKVAAPTAILIGALPGVRQIQSREDARQAFGRQDGDAVWDAFGRARPPLVVPIPRGDPGIAESTSGSCRECGEPLYYTARQRGDVLCGPCHRKATGTQTVADRCRESGMRAIDGAACAEHSCIRHPLCVEAVMRCGCAECQRAKAALTDAPAPSAPTAHGTGIAPDATADDMLPCPFCAREGRPDLLIVDRHPWTGRDPRCVRCQRCGAFGPAQHTGVGPAADREAIANWNRRPAASSSVLDDAADRSLRNFRSERTGYRPGRDPDPAGERYLAAALRSLLEELGLTPSGTGSEDLGIIELEVKRLRAAAPLVDEQRALAGGPAPGTFVRVTAGEHAGFRGTVQPKAADDPPGWCRVQRYLSTETRLFEAKSLDPIESFEERELGDVSDAVRHAEIRKLAAAAGLGEWWVQDMIDAGCTVEQARSHIWTGCGRR